MPPATVHIQGITADLSAANGDYDTITYGLSTPPEVVDFFARIRHLEEPPGDDMCPPSVVLEAGGQSLQFTMGGGHVYCQNTESYVEPAQIPDLVTNPTMAAAVRQQVQQQSGIQPLRMHHVPPTAPDLENTGVDTGPSSPQLRFEIRRSAGSHLTPYLTAFPGLVMMGLGVFVLLNDPISGLIMTGLSAIPVLLFPWLKGRTNKTVRFGFDWKTNTIWVVDELDDTTSVQPNANLISKFVMTKETDWVGSEVVAEDVYAGGGTETHWYLRFHRVDDTWDAFFFVRIFSKKHKDEILNAMSTLLAQQG